MAKQNIAEMPVHRITEHHSSLQQDHLAIEEPLEIQLGYEFEGRHTRKTISITMRTPGDDFALAVGFLFTENIIRHPTDIKRILHIGAPLENNSVRNTLRVELQAGVDVDIKRLERHFYTTSSCGVCGKTSIEALQTLAPFSLITDAPLLSIELIHRLPGILRDAQPIFASTGGLHAAALFDANGTPLDLREDVGRHNAVDKLIGAQLLADELPLTDKLILVSGRASFELVQKALVAGAPVLAAVGAPSSLAVELAHSSGMTLLGFVREQRFNIYSGAWRIREAGVEFSASRIATQSVSVEVIK